MYILDAGEVAQGMGLPACNLSDFATDLLASMVWPNPRKYGIGPVSPEEHPHKAISYPFAITNHSLSQSAAPWYSFARSTPS